MAHANPGRTQPERIESGYLWLMMEMRTRKAVERVPVDDGAELDDPDGPDADALADGRDARDTHSE